MGLYENKNNSLSLLAGGTCYADSPVGAILPFGGSNPPSGYLLCDGQAVSRSYYAELFTIIGTSFGTGDGSTTFNVPDLKGKTTVGLNSSDTDFNAIGKSGGEKTHKLTVSEMPKHNHVSNSLPYASADVNGVNRLAASSGGGTNFTVKTQIVDAGGDGSHNNLQPYVTTNYIIKAKQSAIPLPFEDAIDDKIAALDVASVGGSGKYISAISETDGKISATATNLSTSPTSGSAVPITSGGVYSELHNFTHQRFTDATQKAVTGSGASGRTPVLVWTISNVTVPGPGAYLLSVYVQSLQRMNGPANLYAGIINPTTGSNNGNADLYNTVYAGADYSVMRTQRVIIFNAATTTTLYIGLDIMNNSGVTIQNKALDFVRLSY